MRLWKFLKVTWRVRVIPGMGKPVGVRFWYGDPHTGFHGKFSPGRKMKREAPTGNQRSPASHVREEEGRKGGKKASRFRGDHRTLEAGGGFENQRVRLEERGSLAPGKRVGAT